MIRIPALFVCCAAALTGCVSASAQQPQNAAVSVVALPSYGELAHQVLTSPLVIDATITEAIRLTGENAIGVTPGHARFYVEANVLALIRGAEAMPAAIAYVVELPLDSRGRAPKLKRLRVMLFARPVAGRADQVQLTTLDGQRDWSPALDAAVRGVTREILAADSPPEITGVGNAFHVQGTLPGEGETQIFLTTADDRPVSLQILRRPNQAPRWSVALGEIVDDAAGPPRPDTLLWYRLACGLPAQIPESSLSGQEPADARAAREDFALVRRELGPCPVAQAASSGTGAPLY